MALPYLYIVIILCKWYNRTYNLSGKEHNDECFGYQKEVKKKKRGGRISACAGLSKM
jgi:hypothetical protein